jgi:N-methylhydantoinase A
MSLRLGIDIGGTFTDLVTMDQITGALSMLKTPSIPAHPSRAVINGIEELVDRDRIEPSQISYFVHGTTLALNTVIQRSGALTGLLVTAGFGDILELQRLRLPDPHHFNAERPRALVMRRHVRQIDERVLASGDVYQPLDIQQCVDAARELQDLGVESLAICFLHAYRNPDHEIAAQSAIAEACPDLYLCRSSEVWPQQREYERSLATVINAFVGGKMQQYFASLEREVSAMGVPAPVLSTKSNGGVMSAASAGKAPVQTLLSGPASGVIGARYIGELAGEQRLLTFDMGGTSADIAVIDGQIALSTTNRAGDFPLILPAVDVSSIGAGGGSIVWTDHLGVLKVGPRSAGSSPGPACYGRGGSEATVTDAYVVSGILDPENFLGGTLRLEADRAFAAVGAIATELGLPVERAAEAILEVATSNMYAEFVPALAQHGVDPADFVLLPYGGAGPTHAFMLADEVNLRRVIVPPSPGTLCALGCLVADLRADFVRTVFEETSRIEQAALDEAFSAVKADAQAWLDDQRIPVEGATFISSADMRYKGQSFEIAVDLDGSICAIGDLVRAFGERYRAIYGYADPEAETEIINVRGTVIGRVPHPELARVAVATAAAAPVAERQVHYRGLASRTPVYDRGTLGAGHILRGPAVVEQYDSTTFVTPGWEVTVDSFGNLVAEAVAHDRR